MRHEVTCDPYLPEWVTDYRWCGATLHGQSVLMAERGRRSLIIATGGLPP